MWPQLALTWHRGSFVQWHYFAMCWTGKGGWATGLPIDTGNCAVVMHVSRLLILGTYGSVTCHDYLGWSNSARIMYKFFCRCSLVRVQTLGWSWEYCVWDSTSEDPSKVRHLRRPKGFKSSPMLRLKAPGEEIVLLEPSKKWSQAEGLFP